MTDTGLVSLPFGIMKSSRAQNTPVWTTRYRPSFVSRTASENRRKALVDYLAVSAGSKIDDNNFPNAVVSSPSKFLFLTVSKCLLIIVETRT